MQSFTILFLSLLTAMMSSTSLAAEVGREAAQKYFTPRNPSDLGPSGTALHLLSIHFGGYTDDESFYWGDKRRGKDFGVSTMGVTYRIGEWTNSMDLHLRFDFNRYEVDGEDPLKMSVMPLITFPDAASGFPLYFGAGLGAGIFFRQLGDESNLSFDYQLIAGARFFDLLGQAGLFIESGMKNHLHLLSNGQYTGIFVAGGAVFRF